MSAKAENRDPLSVDCVRCGAKAGHACMFGRSERHQRFHLPRMKAVGMEPKRRKRRRDKPRQPRTPTQLLAALDKAIKHGDLERVASLERQLDRLLLSDEPAPPRPKSPRHPGYGIDESRLHEYDLELDAGLDAKLQDEAA
jgi:hypothetical protein